MINYTFRDETTKQNYKRVTKPIARRAFCDGKTVIVCPSNLRPFSMWHCETVFNINRESFQNELKNTDTTPENLFNYTVNLFLITVIQIRLIQKILLIFRNNC